MSFILLVPGDSSIFGHPSIATAALSDESRAWMAARNLTGPAFELLSVNQHLQQAGDDFSDAARGQPLLDPLSLEKRVDIASPKLYEYCLRGRPLGQGAHQPTIIYLVRNSGDNVANILTVELRDAIISEIHFKSEPDDMPTEQFKLNFTEIIWRYAVNAPNGGQTSVGWSRKIKGPIASFTD